MSGIKKGTIDLTNSGKSSIIERPIDVGPQINASENFKNIEPPPDGPILYGFHSRSVPNLSDRTNLGTLVEDSWNSNRAAILNQGQQLNITFNSTVIEGFEAYNQRVRDTQINDQEMTTFGKIRAVQTFVNTRMTYETDMDFLDRQKIPDHIRNGTERTKYGSEFWKTPEEIIADGFRGDCDEAITMKHDMLIEMGVPPEKITLLVGMQKTKTPLNDDGTPNAEEIARLKLLPFDNAFYGAHITLAVEYLPGKIGIMDNGKNNTNIHADDSGTMIPLYAIRNGQTFMFESNAENDPISAIKEKIKGTPDDQHHETFTQSEPENLQQMAPIPPAV